MYTLIINERNFDEEYLDKLSDLAVQFSKKALYPDSYATNSLAEATSSIRNPNLNKCVIDSLYVEDKFEIFTSYYSGFNRHTANWVDQVIKDNTLTTLQTLHQN